jgi:hypothetical protein
MNDLVMPRASEVYFKQDHVVIFNQLARKIPMDGVSNQAYYTWLDRMKASVGSAVPGAEIAEKATARDAPPLNTAIYYDTADRDILPTGALLRTSCNKITHAFCAFKMAEDAGSVRKDHRYVFDGEEKRTIQAAPDSPAAIAIVRRLMARDDIEHPGIFLETAYGFARRELSPSIRLDSLRFTFFGWLDGQDALRCSIDRYDVMDLRSDVTPRVQRPVAEVELAVYPRIAPTVAADARVIQLIDFLSTSLCETFSTHVTRDIKYQRAAQALGVDY